MRAHTHTLSRRTHTHRHTQTTEPINRSSRLVAFAFRGRFSSPPLVGPLSSRCLFRPSVSHCQCLGLLVSRAGLWPGLYSDWMHSRFDATTVAALPPHFPTPAHSLLRSLTSQSIVDSVDFVAYLLSSTRRDTISDIFSSLLLGLSLVGEKNNY